MEGYVRFHGLRPEDRFKYLLNKLQWCVREWLRLCSNRDRIVLGLSLPGVVQCTDRPVQVDREENDRSEAEYFCGGVHSML